MLPQEMLKALVEAILFTADKPVTLRQIQSRIRHINAKMQQAKSLPAEAMVQTDETPVVEVEVAEYLTDDAHFIAAGLPLHLNLLAQPAVNNNEVMTTESDVGSDDVAVLAQLAARQQELAEEVSADEIRKILFTIDAELESSDRGLELVQVAKGYQFRTKLEVAALLKDEKPVAPIRFSPSSLETLAIISYEQPVTRSKIEEVRGVDCGGVLKTLLDRDFVRIIGRSEELGRPLIYGTTAKFLEIFGLNSLKDLPSPAEFADLVSAENADLSVSDVAHEEESDGNDYTHSRDFVDEESLILSESERAVLDELDASLEQLREVEKSVTGQNAEKSPPPEDLLPPS